MFYIKKNIVDKKTVKMIDCIEKIIIFAAK